MKALSDKERENARRYEDAEPKQFGNLHERMKFLLAAARACELFTIDNATWQAIHDLETEVRYYAPVEPPYGRR